MKIFFAASEAVPFAKSGGLADVAGSLPKEIAKLGHEVTVFMPKYLSIDEQKHGLEFMQGFGPIPVRINGKVNDVYLHKSKLPGSEVPVYFIDSPYYFNREKLYTDDGDEDARFILFQKGVIEAVQWLGLEPDIVHVNDWQTGLIPLLLKDNYSWDKKFDKTAAVLTIHNIGYQGKFSPQALANAEIKGSYFYPGGPISENGEVNFLKAGISYADVINTVSPTYAKEIQTMEGGAGLHHVLWYRKYDLYGILNGVDYDEWSPEKDKLIYKNYSAGDLEGKKENKRALCEQMGLEYKEDVPLIGIVSRMAYQKGFDIIADVIFGLANLNAQWVILGSGQPEYEKLFTKVSDVFHNFKVYIGYNNKLAHQIEAGSDIFLMPSLYEPCGLNQIYSLKYGTVPVVRKTGGLADTVHDWNEHLFDKDDDSGTGFTFNSYTGEALYSTVVRALGDYHNKDTWRKIMLNGMKKDYSWHASAEKYVELYEKALTKI